MSYSHNLSHRKLDMRPLLLDLRHYETIVGIVDFETMTDAAANLAITQSALSHRLAEAERRLGKKLFHRGRNRRLTPTRDGLAIHQAASRALQDLALTEANLLASSSPAITTLRIAVGSYDCYHWFPDFLAHVRRTLPEIDLELVVVGDAPGSSLAAGTVDIVIAPGRPEGNVELRALFDDELVLITSNDHPLSSRQQIDVDDLAAETYLTYNAQPAPGFEYDRFIRPAQSYPLIVKVVRQTSAITELVAAGAGVSILSRWALAPVLQAGRVSAALCGAGLPLTWHAATRRDDRDTAAVVEELASFLRAREQDNDASL